jgi:hypothetical protein
MASPTNVRGQPRLYPNLRPVALKPGEMDAAYVLQHWYGHFSLRAGAGCGQYVPNARYLFVRTAQGATLVHPRMRHAALADGKPVLYAGEAFFESGSLRWWSNGSGHYRPDPGHAEQAGLPRNLFRTWDDVIRRGTRAQPQAPPGAREASNHGRY